MKVSRKNWLLNYLIPAVNFSNNNEHYKVIFATYGENKKIIYDDKLMYPIIDTLVLDERSYFLNLTFSQRCDNEYVQSRFVKEDLSLREFFFSLFFIDRKYFQDLFYIYMLYNSELAYSDLGNGKLKKYTKFYQFLKVFFVSRYFAVKYRNLIGPNVEKLYLCQYYNIRMLGLVRACNLKGIKVLDVQHGYLGMDHAAYNNILTLKSSYKPNGFCVFDEGTAKYIKNLAGDSYLEITNWKHLKSFHRKPNDNKKRKRVLYSLQWGTPIPDKLKVIVLNYENVDWVFRMHPLESKVREDIKEIVTMKHVMIEPPCINLVDSLLASDVHITWNSSLCLEAEQLGVISFFLSDHDKVRFVTDDGQEKKLIKFLSDSSFSYELDRLLK